MKVIIFFIRRIKDLLLQEMLVFQFARESWAANPSCPERNRRFAPGQYPVETALIRVGGGGAEEVETLTCIDELTPLI